MELARRRRSASKKGTLVVVLDDRDFVDVKQKAAALECRAQPAHPLDRVPASDARQRSGRGLVFLDVHPGAGHRGRPGLYRVLLQ